MKKVIWGALLVVAVVASGCKTGSASGGGATNATSTTLQQAYDDAVASGSLPKLDTSVSLVGPDSDKNGVRDDIDAYISNSSFTLPQKAALRQASASLTYSLTIDFSNNAAVQAASDKMNRGVSCIYKSFDHAIALDEVHDMQRVTINTKPRIDAYFSFSQALSGSLIGDVEGNPCD